MNNRRLQRVNQLSAEFLCQVFEDGRIDQIALGTIGQVESAACHVFDLVFDANR